MHLSTECPLSLAHQQNGMLCNVSVIIKTVRCRAKGHSLLEEFDFPARRELNSGSFVSPLILIGAAIHGLGALLLDVECGGEAVILPTSPRNSI
jgi:hypothetical protein